MGFSHYFNRAVKLDKDSYAAWQIDVQKMIAESDVPIFGSSGYGSPAFTANQTVFNGDARFNDDHETFSVPRVFNTKTGYVSKDEHGFYFDCCKTAQKPYDEVVVGALILLAYYFPEGCEVRSDGDVFDWQKGLELARNINGSVMLPPEIRPSFIEH